MKLKEVCESTGLSRKTIRLYEEKGLLVPRKEHKNGRDYREYTPEDVEILREIATLRRAWFTMDEIARMQQDPDAIEEIFPQYLEWLEKQQMTLESLLTAARAVDPAKVKSVSELSKKMREAETMPLPAVDIEPRFRYLDEMEQRPPKVEPEWTGPLPGGISDSRTYRQLVAASSKDKADDLGVTAGQLREMEQQIRELKSKEPWQPSGPVQREETEPKWVKRASRLGELLLVLGLLIAAITEISTFGSGSDYQSHISRPFAIGIAVIIVGIIIIAIARGIFAYRKQQDWAERMRRQDEEKRKSN